MTTFYDYSGTPIVYSRDGIHVYSFPGEPLAYFHGNSLYSFSGSHVGWHVNGWIYDNVGFAVLFSETSRGGPLRPLRKIKPLRGIRALRPLKGIRQIRPLRPSWQRQWSDLTLNDLLGD